MGNRSPSQWNRSEETGLLSLKDNVLKNILFHPKENQDKTIYWISNNITFSAKIRFSAQFSQHLKMYLNISEGVIWHNFRDNTNLTEK